MSGRRTIPARLPRLHPAPAAIIAAVLTVIAAAGPAVTAAAEVSLVRSGEHPGFSRLVARIPEGAAWRLERGERRARISVSAPDLRFDTAAVFERIPRTRLRAIAAGRERAMLDLTLGCDCPVTAFTVPGPHLVIDIADPPRRAALPLPAMIPANAGPYRFRPALRMAARPVFAPVPVPPEDAAGKVAPAAAVLPGPDAADAGPAFLWRPDPIAAAARTAWRARLLRTLQALAQRGTLDPARPALHRIAEAPARTEGRIAGSRPAGPATAKPGAARPAMPPPGNMRISLPPAGDPGLRRTARRVSRISPPGGTCPPGPILHPPGRAGAGGQGAGMRDRRNAGADGSGAGFAAEIGAWRRRLATDDGQIDPQAATELARTYLRNGFGAEAAQILALLPETGTGPETGSGTRFLAEIAAIIDAPPAGARPASGPGSEPGAGTSPPAPPVPSVAGCSDEAVFWLSLIHGAPAGRSAGERIARAYLALPLPLRTHLGPHVARLLADDGEAGASRIVFRAWERAVAQAAAGSGAELPADDGGGPPPGSGETVAGEALLPPEAARLLEQTERHLRERRPLPEEVPDLLAAHAFELRSTEAGAMLAGAHAVALALNGRYDEAFEAVAAAAIAGQSAGNEGNTPFARAPHARGSSARASPAHAPPAGTAAMAAAGRAGTADRRGDVYLLLAEGADDITFLRHALALSETGRPALPPAAAAAVAARLRSLGFAAPPLTVTATAAADATTAATADAAATTAAAAGAPPPEG